MATYKTGDLLPIEIKVVSANDLIGTYSSDDALKVAYKMRTQGYWFPDKVGIYEFFAPGDRSEQTLGLIENLGTIRALSVTHKDAPFNTYPWSDGEEIQYFWSDILDHDAKIWRVAWPASEFDESATAKIEANKEMNKERRASADARTANTKDRLTGLLARMLAGTLHDWTRHPQFTSYTQLAGVIADQKLTGLKSQDYVYELIKAACDAAASEAQG